MAVGYRSITVLGFTNSDATVTVNKPPGTAEGDVLVMNYFADDFGAEFDINPDDTTPWVLLGFTTGAQFNGGGVIKSFYRVAEAGEPESYLFTHKVDSGSIVTLAAFTGADPAAPVTQWSIFDGTATFSTEHIAPSAFGHAGGMLVSGWTCGAQAADAAYTPPISMIERADATDTFPFQLAAVATEALTVDGETGSRTAILTGAPDRRWYGVSMVVNAPVPFARQAMFLPFFE